MEYLDEEEIGMKKKYKNSICLLLTIALFFTSNVSTFAKETEINGGDMLQELYEETVATSEIITREMELEIESTMRASYLESVMKSRNQYSDYYGGCYLNNGELIVKLTDTSDDVIAYFKDILGGTINYEKCVASLSELEMIHNHVLNYVKNCDKNTDELAKSIISIAIYIKQNKVCVAIKDCTEEKISLFKEKIIDSEQIIFESTQGYVNETTYVKPGEKIYITISGEKKLYSVGFRCKKLESNGSYAYGFVTAAHKGVSLSSVVYAADGLTRIGQVYSLNYTNNGTVDAAFVEIINASYDCSNTLFQTGASLIASTGNLYEGNSVYKAGRSAAVSSGEIISTTATLLDDDELILTTNLYQATYTSSGGDSGGVVYAGNRIIAGIHKGKDPMRNNTTFAVKASNIRSVLGVTQY